MATMTKENQKKAGLIECTLNDIMFPVEKIEQTDFACNSDYSHDIFGYIGSDIDKGIMGVKTRLNTCSDRYKLITNEEVFMPVRELLLSKGIDFTENYMQKDNARFYGQFSINDNPYMVNGNTEDKIFPMLRVQHSYNGLTKYMISFGYFRLVCSNGLTIPVKEMNEFNIGIGGKHTVSIEVALKKLTGILNRFVEQSKDFTHNFDILAQKEVLNWQDRITEVMTAAKVSMGNKPANTMDYFSSVINRESDFYGGVTNDFIIYNAINQYTNDNKINSAVPEKRVETDRNVLMYMLS